MPALLGTPQTKGVQTFKDAPYSVSMATVVAAITCPIGLRQSPGGIVLLVHGTGSRGNESFELGPYVKLLPTAGKGYDPCWVDLPGRAGYDVQQAAEYVALAVQHLAPLSATGKVAILGHSQGAGINPQWALIFWPSIHSLVSQYLALAADFHGTLEFEDCMAATGGCSASVWQQRSSSTYLKAQNNPMPGGGGRALVPTTSIFTIQDDVVLPENPRLSASSYLPGAGVHALQDDDICGPTHVADHFTMIFDPAAYGLVLAALENGGPVDTALFDKSFCTYIKDNVVTNNGYVASLVGAVVGVFNTTQIKLDAEPTLQPYVCERGYATECGKAF
ncbi:hypothetical protein RQP46_008071 [Phenoliferia psychrophenolica]